MTAEIFLKVFSSETNCEKKSSDSIISIAIEALSAFFSVKDNPAIFAKLLTCEDKEFRFPVVSSVKASVAVL